MEEGAAKAGKDASKLILGCVIVGSIGRDSKKGKEGAREQAAMYLANKVQNIKGSADVLLESAGITFEELQPVADAMETGGRKAAAQAVSDELLRKVCPIAGTPDECIQKIEEYRAAGCTHIMLEIWGDDRTGQAKLFGDEVLPHFRRVGCRGQRSFGKCSVCSYVFMPRGSVASWLSFISPSPASRSLPAACSTCLHRFFRSSRRANIFRLDNLL